MNPLDKRFSEVILLLRASRTNALKAVNAELINLYWNVGQYVSNKVNTSDWGQSVVKELAVYIHKTEPDLKGFSDKNIWRMKQFYEAYKDFPKLSTPLREISWKITLNKYQEMNNTTERTATRDLLDLVEKGVIKSSGIKGAGAYYTLTNNNAIITP